MLPLLAVLFFLSGTSALIYQIVWLRLLSLVFGVTVYAASTVLASFMAGLALGSTLAGRLADRSRRPLRLFGAAEILIAATALLAPLALDAVSAVYVRLASGAEGRAALTVARFLCSALVLLPPTILMGATLPLVLRSSLVEAAGIGPRIGLLYGINTAGAIAGALLAGFFLIGAAGLTGASRVAAALNVAVGVSAILVSRWTGAGREAGARGPAAATPRGGAPGGAPAPSKVLLVVFFVSGLASLALEVVWFRSLVLYYPATTYAFTAMLATVLAGIAGGSLIAAPLLRWREPSLVVFGVLHALIGIAAAGGLIGLGSSYGDTPASRSLLEGAVVTILPAAILMGAAFPVGCRLWLTSASDAGRRLGVLYGVNLAGAIVGSLLAGFVLLPWLGSARALVALGAVGTLTGAGLLLIAARHRPRVALPLALGAAVLFATLARDVPDPFVTGLTKRYPDAGRVFMREEGVQTTVSVHVRELGGRQLFLDGLHQASDGRDVVRLHRQIGHLPVLLHPGPRRALVIGLGGGATAGAVSLHPGLQVDVVELAPGVVRAAAWFTHVNAGVLDRPNVRVIVDDARNFLMMRPEGYDVITADIIQPTHAGAGLLYSREYFQLARQALNPGGVMVQWVGQRSLTHYKLIARTFQHVFPDTTVWVDGSLLVGSTRPLALDAASFAERFGDPQLRDALSQAGFTDAEGLLGQYTAGADELRAFLGAGPVLTDDRPSLEYYLSLPEDTQPADLSVLGSGRRHPRP